jgi:hypothetical protein
MGSARREPFSIRIGRSRIARSFFLGLATFAASLGFPIKVEPPPPRRTPIEVVRDEDEPEREPAPVDHETRGPVR